MLIILRCKQCDKSFTPKNKNHKFCSKKCGSKYHDNKKKPLAINKICNRCGKEFATFYRNSGKWCSKSCKEKAFMKRKWKRWKKQGRQSANQIYKEIILSFLGNKCTMCKIDKNLQIHHKTLISLGGTNHYTNIVVLCRKCHVVVHREINGKR